MLSVPVNIPHSALTPVIHKLKVENISKSKSEKWRQVVHFCPFVDLQRKECTLPLDFVSFGKYYL